MKQLVLTLASLFVLTLTATSLQAQGCTLEISSKCVMKLSCASLDDTEFELSTNALGITSEAVAQRFCPLASSNYLTFVPIEGSTNVHVTLMQGSTPGKSWTPADWNAFFERNAERTMKALENSKR